MFHFLQLVALKPHESNLAYELATVLGPSGKDTYIVELRFPPHPFDDGLREVPASQMEAVTADIIAIMARA